ncbi:hypothetical protein PMIN07_005301 [Paraphaeosphaeria minitans]
MTTHIRPHTASQTPKRPVSSYSMSSTIRQVTPSPDSLSRGYATHSTPRHRAHTQSLNDRRPTSRGERRLVSGEEQAEHDDDAQGYVSRARSVNSPSYHRPNKSRSRRTTPSRIPVPAPGRSKAVGHLKRSKAGRISPSKLGAPRQHRTLLSSSPATPGAQVVAAASGSHAASAGLAMPAAPTRPPAPAPEDDRQRLREFTLFPTEDPFAPHVPSQPRSPVPQPVAAVAMDPTGPAARRGSNCFQHGETYYEHEPDVDSIAPLPTSPSQSPWRKQPQHIGSDVPPPLRPLTTRTRTTSPVEPHLPRQGSARSVASTFSTPGRDEMERKRGIVEEGPFMNAMGVKELEERRRMVSEGKGGVIRVEEGGKKKRKAEDEKGGMCRCVVM